MSACVLVWHRGDLRVHDHAALHAAAASGLPLLGVVVLDAAIIEASSLRRQALFTEAAGALRAEYRARGGVLLVRPGLPERVLPELAQQLGAVEVHALRSHSPYGVQRDERADAALLQRGVRMRWHEGLYVHAPGTVRTRANGAFSVYGPFARRWWEMDVPAPLDAPAAIQSPVQRVAHGELPQVASDVPLPEPGEAAALQRLERFARRGLARYAEARDRLDGSGSSRLSIDIALGTLSARVAYHRMAARTGESAKKWLGELAWRDFMADLLHHRPLLQQQPLDAQMAALPWRSDVALFTAWRDGRTGIPVVDAAMRQLRATGWISNRARMVSAQLLTKHLLVDWRLGEQLFRQWLLDGDAASNVGNWQWAAGLGVDSAPWFRVFNPVTQGKQHDPDGAWLRRWVPESGGDPRPLPHAIVDLAEARRDYLDAVQHVRRSGRTGGATQH